MHGKPTRAARLRIELLGSERGGEPEATSLASDLMHRIRSIRQANERRVVQDFDFETSLGYWLTVSTQAIHRALNVELSPTGITYRQSQVVGWLKLEGALSVGDLAARMTIEPPTLVGILDRMERMGWIVRDACTDDRRRKLIRLTAEADPVWEQIIECCLRVRRAATAGLSPEQSEQLLSLLCQVHGNLVSADADRAAPQPLAEV